MDAWKAAGRTRPEAFQQLLSILDIRQAAAELDVGAKNSELLRGRLFRAVLKPGDTLFVPVFMLHEVGMCVPLWF